MRNIWKNYLITRRHHIFILDYFNLATHELDKEKGRQKGEIGTPMKDAILYCKDKMLLVFHI